MPVVVETVTKSSTIKTFAAAQPQHDSDASKVTSKGAGLQQADVNKDATFTVDTSRAGWFFPHLSVVAFGFVFLSYTGQLFPSSFSPKPSVLPSLVAQPIASKHSCCKASR